jgi:plasmid stability protein
MSKMIQLRNVPDALHRTLKARAAKSGLSLSDYLVSAIRQIAERPTIEELAERLRHRRPAHLSISAAEIIRAERESR